MLQFLVLALIAANFSFALPTVSHVKTITKRTDSLSLVQRGQKYHHPPKYHTHKTTTTTTPLCPTGTPYYLQAAQNGEYAAVTAEPAVAADAFAIQFNQPTSLTATAFTFVLASNKGCRLSLFPTNALPNGLAFMSYVVDSPAGTFNDPNILSLIGPVPPDPATYTTTDTICHNIGGLLDCLATNPFSVDGEYQHVLQLGPDGVLYVSYTEFFGTSTVFNLVPVL